MSRVRTVKCPQCGAQVEWVSSNPWRPFCSERCKGIDLGAWAAETYRIAGDQPPLGEDDREPR